MIKSDGNLVHFLANAKNLQDGVSSKFINESRNALERLKNETDY